MISSYACPARRGHNDDRTYFSMLYRQVARALSVMTIPAFHKLKHITRHGKSIEPITPDREHVHHHDNKVYKGNTIFHSYNSSSKKSYNKNARSALRLSLVSFRIPLSQNSSRQMKAKSTKAKHSLFYICLNALSQHQKEPAQRCVSDSTVCLSGFVKVRSVEPLTFPLP